MDTASLVTSLLVSTVGLGVFLFGKKQQRPPQLVAGLALMLFPYFVPDPLVMTFVAVTVVALLVLAVRRGW